MDSRVHGTGSGDWNGPAIAETIKQLWALRNALIDSAHALGPSLKQVDPAFRHSATNLVHYLALRRVDLRELQRRLAQLGVSSMGRAESHVLANLDKALGILHRLAGRPWSALQADEPAGYLSGAALLRRHTDALFGDPPTGREVRIMVTLPSEAARDATLVAGLVRSGMDVARINCAHDGPAHWKAMAGHVRAAARDAGRAVKILMDLGGPKLRTGPIEAGPAVVRLRPLRDAFGRVTRPALLGLRPAGSIEPVAGADLSLAVDATWLQRLKADAKVELTDTRGAHRTLKVAACHADHALLESEHTCYLGDDTRLQSRRGQHSHASALYGIAQAPGRLHLQRGQVLHLVPQGLGHGPQPGARSRRARPATIACTLPEALACLHKGERVWFDDGRIGGVVLRGGARRAEIEITDARDGGEHLAADKGINLPDSRLDLPALTAQDLLALDSVVALADMVGLSFAQSAADVHALRAQLVQRSAAHLGMVLKIETRRGFDHLPEMLLAAMHGPASGVMIARGDLAVECGYERLAEVQEEILWACEAAHMPVVWATQVLETMARTGLPSRSEITDAAMGGRAECVMLNKGAHILDAMRMLDDILRRMQAHQSKKRPLLRALKSWDLAASTGPTT